MCSRQPEVLWAQRSEKVYLTISLPDAKDVSLKCDADGVFNFSAIGVNGDSFSVTLQLYGNVIPEVFFLLFSVKFCFFFLGFRFILLVVVILLSLMKWVDGRFMFKSVFAGICM